MGQHNRYLAGDKPFPIPQGAAMQTTLLIILIILGALATLGVLARGIYTMARGRDITGRQSNKLMSYRVALQLLTIIFIVALFLLNRA